MLTILRSLQRPLRGMVHRTFPSLTIDRNMSFRARGSFLVCECRCYPLALTHTFIFNLTSLTSNQILRRFKLPSLFPSPLETRHAYLHNYVYLLSNASLIGFRRVGTSNRSNHPASILVRSKAFLVHASGIGGSGNLNHSRANKHGLSGQLSAVFLGMLCEYHASANRFETTQIPVA